MRITPATTPEDLYRPVLEALRFWHRSSPENLLDFLLLVRERSAGLAAKYPDPSHLLAARRAATNEVLLLCLEALAVQAPEDAKILRSRFVRRESTRMVSNSLFLSPFQINRRQHSAVLQLAALLLEREREFRRLRTREFETSLPARQYSRLYGVKKVADELFEMLLPGQEPWVLVLSGLGGIGKTALAHFLTIATVHEYGPENVHWLFVPTSQDPVARPEETYKNLLNDLAARLTTPEGTPPARRTQAQRILKNQPHLVVIDNLESEDDTVYVLEQVFNLAQPAKFLLTTRANPAGTAGVYKQRIGELAYEDAASLVRDLSRETGMAEREIREEASLRAIYRAVGGNPLALKLVVAMTDRFPLAKVLDDLGERQLSETDAMYTRVFQRAWNALSPDARELLEGMPLVAEDGGAPDQLLSFSGLPEKRFWKALNELQARSLLEARGSATERRYGIHQLTRAFLQTEIISRSDPS